jgi:transcription antitermination factor NusG
MSMIQVATANQSAGVPMNPSLESGGSRWYAAYTCPRREKRVAEHLSLRAVEHFLALHVARRRWKDRQKFVEFPLFPGYVFVRIELKNRLRILEVPGVVHLVSFNGLPAALPDHEIDGLRSDLANIAHVQPYPYTNLSLGITAGATVGRRVRIKHGPFSGLEGKLVRRKGSVHVILSIEMIQRSLLVDVDFSSVEFVVPLRQ